MRSEESGVSARVYKNGVYGFAAGAEYTDDNIKAVIEAAEQNALFMDSRINKNKPPFPVISSGKITLSRDVRDIEQKPTLILQKRWTHTSHQNTRIWQAEL